MALTKEKKKKDSVKNKKINIKLLIIVVVGVILGVGCLFGVNKLNSNNEEVTVDSIKDKALTYIKKNKREWNTIDLSDENEYTCVSLEELISDKYIDGTKLEGLDITNYLVITRDKNKKIVSNEFTKDYGLCRKNVKVSVPDSDEVCNNLRYDGNSYNLINTDNSYEAYSFVNRVEVEAGSYPVDLILRDSYVWSDGTVEDKSVICNIKKANPKLLLSSKGHDGTIIGSSVVTLKSNVSGKVYLKSTDVNHVTLDEEVIDIVADVDRDITINTISVRDKITDVTMNFVPSDEYSKNYENISVVYKVGKIEEKSVDVPTDEDFCNKNLVYNQSLQKLTKKPKQGYSFLDNEGINALEYKVLAVLDYGYVWSDGTHEDKEISCGINKKVSDIVVSNNLGEIMKEEEAYLELNANTKGSFEVLSNNIIEVNELISSDIDEPNFSQLFFKGIQNVDNGIITLKFIPFDTNNYEIAQKDYELKIISNEFVLNYDDNGGSGCSSVLKNVYYNKAYGDLCVPRKEGYEFIGWYEKKDDRSNEVNLETVLDKDNDVTIYAHYRRPIVVTLTQYEGTHIKNVELLSYVYNDDNGVKVMLPKALEYADDRCDGWTSLGWSTSDDASDGNVEYKGNKEYLFSNDLVLYAKYEKKVVFSYDTNGGDEIKSKIKFLYRNASGKVSSDGNWVEYVDRIPVRGNCKFLGWYNNQELEISAEALKKGIPAVVEYGCNGYKLTAKWAKGCK